MSANLETAFTANPTTARRKRRARIDDAPFVAALGFEFRSAPTIARHMLEQGTPATLAAIRARMTEFVCYSDEIETNGEGWRIASTAPSPEPSNDNIVMPEAIIVGGATLYNADVLDALRAIPSGSVDLVFTSPPYNLRSKRRVATGKWKNSKLLNEGYELHDDAMNDADYIEWQKEVLRECWRVLTDDGAIYYNHKARIVDGQLLHPTRFNPGLPLRQIVTWDRGNGFNFSRSHYLPCSEQILIFAKPAFRLRDQKASGAKDVWRIAPEAPSNKHCAPFPVALPRMAIETTNAKVILDPFAGSGSTGVAALELGRQFIGIENGPETFDGSVERIRACQTPKSLMALPAEAISLHGSCGLELMRGLPDASVDLVLCDLPYGTTRASCDPKIDVAAWMAEMRRVVTDTGAIVAFAAQPFTTDLIAAGRDLFKQSLVWEKPVSTGFQQARARHLKSHEDILVFSKGTVISKRSLRQMTFNPQGVEFVTKKMRPRRLVNYLGQAVSGSADHGKPYDAMTSCPRSVLRFPKDNHHLHPFAKPVALLEYLIRTFSNEGEVVLDPSMGSGSTGVACISTARKFVGAENGYDDGGKSFFDVAKDRITQA